MRTLGDAAHEANPAAVRTVRVVDDNVALRHAIVAAIVGAIERLTETPNEWNPRVPAYKYIWDLTTDPAVRSGDIAVCDLYPSGYWHDVPDDPPPGPIFPQTPIDIDEGQNVVKASFDIAERFLFPLQARGVHVIVFTYVPRFLRTRDNTVAHAWADSVEQQLGSRLELVHKEDPSSDARIVDRIVGRVAELLTEGAS
ncbi:hypothetical protein OJ998_10830 [Solirubrobacter taibaiensis]|nr:hypothetical protein [Solirubrobacter taibaiensis]